MLRRDYLIAGQRLQAGDTVIDIGANIGCFSIQAAKIVGPSGMVIAVEPDKSTFDQLLENIKINKLTNVMPIRSAVGGAQGSITLRSSPNRLFSSVFASVNGHDVEGEQQEVDLTTLENLMQAYKVARCDYLKLDCEGAEHDIVGAMSKATATKVLQITMEVHKVPDRDGQVLVDRLRMLGYERLGASTLPYYAQRSVVASPGASLTV